MNKNKNFKDVYGGASSTVVEILKKREYLGHTVNFKTRKHFKDKIKEKKKAEIEAKKATIRVEDIAKGVFVPVSSLP